jgi:hypothetical protein
MGVLCLGPRNLPQDYPIRCGHDGLRAATRARLEDRTHRGGHGYGGRPPLQLLEAQIEISAAAERLDWTKFLRVRFRR